MSLPNYQKKSSWRVLRQNSRRVGDTGTFVTMWYRGHQDGTESKGGERDAKSSGGTKKGGALKEPVEAMNEEKTKWKFWLSGVGYDEKVNGGPRENEGGEKKNGVRQQIKFIKPEGKVEDRGKGSSKKTGDCDRHEEKERAQLEIDNLSKLVERVMAQELVQDILCLQEPYTLGGQVPYMPVTARIMVEGGLPTSAKVEDQVTSSDHNLVRFEVRGKLEEEATGWNTRKYDMKRASWNIFKESLILPSVTMEGGNALLVEILGYGASTWAHRLRNILLAKKLLSLQRNVLMRITGAYRSVATDALTTVLGIRPLDLQGLAESPTCDCEELATPEHVVLECPEKEIRREQVDGTPRGPTRFSAHEMQGIRLKSNRIVINGEDQCCLYALKYQLSITAVWSNSERECSFIEILGKSSSVSVLREFLIASLAVQDLLLEPLAESLKIKGLAGNLSVPPSYDDHYLPTQVSLASEEYLIEEHASLSAPKSCKRRNMTFWHPAFLRLAHLATTQHGMQCRVGSRSGINRLLDLSQYPWKLCHFMLTYILLYLVVEFSSLLVHYYIVEPPNDTRRPLFRGPHQHESRDVRILLCDTIYL
uniref:Uncharacterized protein n=1 Tax=Timema bartmani TaxID=61472 RepID=A0A7R9ESR3_9NEOP|nr:unnamed protein product [Timema bartmani]